MSSTDTVLPRVTRREVEYLKVYFDYSQKHGHCWLTYREIKKKNLLLNQNGNIPTQADIKRTNRKLRGNDLIEVAYFDNSGNRVDPTTFDSRGIGANHRVIILTPLGVDVLRLHLGENYIRKAKRRTFRLPQPVQKAPGADPGGREPWPQAQHTPGPQVSDAPGHTEHTVDPALNRTALALNSDPQSAQEILNRQKHLPDEILRQIRSSVQKDDPIRPVFSDHLQAHIRRIIVSIFPEARFETQSGVNEFRAALAALATG